MRSEGTVELELARHQWEEGTRALRRSDSSGAVVLERAAAIVTGELARRVGQVFTLSELARVYRGADDWAPVLLGEELEGEVPAGASRAVDAAFDRYARRASDYAP